MSDAAQMSRDPDLPPLPLMSKLIRKGSVLSNTTWEAPRATPEPEEGLAMYQNKQRLLAGGTRKGPL